MKVAPVLLLAIALCIASPASSIRIRTRDQGLDGIGITASPTLIYRRRLNSDRYQSIYPPTAPSNSIEETKTDPDPYNSSYGQETTDEPPITTSSIRPKKVKSYRRNRSRIRTVALPQASVDQQQYTTKPAKSKGGRRRKVKRPTKTKPLLTNTVDELGEKSNSSTSTGGDKNLALEIESGDGKYALIDKFFDDKLAQAPGLISYKASDDFPRNDNKQNFGNVKEKDIWLSDGHLLVLKGGDLDASLREHWKPIDNYQRGNRPPLRIALDSNNPPPFPVFLNETGPPIFLGPPPPFGLPYPPPGAFNETFDPSRFPPPGMVPLYPNGSIPEFFRPRPPPGQFSGGFGGGNNSLYPNGPPPGQYGGGGYGQGGGNGSFPPFPFQPPPGRFGNNSFPPPPPFFPFPPPGHRNGSGPIFFPPPPGFNGNGSGGPPFPFLPPLVLNPNDNETDDPSIFLPPPYDFDYQDDNTTIVPPGPFAPGLVVPPPRDFYTVYNKTTKRPTQPPAIGLSYSFGNKRPQRPNAKKPKFPMTNPPDDSEEAYQPLVTTPLPYPSEVPLKKRKQRPGKANKGIFAGTKFEADADIDTVIVATPRLPVGTQYVEPQSPPPVINIPVITNTIATSPKPLNNYVYVRGQLKSLAELNQPQQEQYDYDPTPRPPFDEHGYPNRFVDDSDQQQPVLQYNKKPTELPPKSFYYNTPKYDAIYNTYNKKPKKLRNHQYFSTNQNDQNPVSPRPQLPIVLDQQSPSIYLNNRLTNQDQIVYTSGVNTNAFQDNGSPIAPNPYYNTRTNNKNGLSQQKQVIQLQSPKSYLTNSNSNSNNNRQPHFYNHANIPQNNNNNYQPTSAFRPVFGPSVHPRQQQTKVQYPGGQVTQNGPIFDFRTQAYQQQGRPQIDGYYSPITQYYQPLSQQQQQNNFFPTSQPFFNNQQYQDQNLNPNYQQTSGGFQPFFGQQNQLQGNGQGLSGQYKSPIHQFLTQSQQTPIQQDVYVNYREPLPQYNTESEAVTTRTNFKAGPSKAPFSATEAKTGVNVNADGSYYSFQRGGPGGFSYKIKL